LRKDFLIHPLQAAETAATPASALLLITRLLDRNELTAMLEAASKAGLEAVLEIFSPDDLELARSAWAEGGSPPLIIQVNTRDLNTLTVDNRAARSLITRKKEEEVWICASGISSRREVDSWAELGFDAVLAGTFLMSASDPGAALTRLTARGVRGHGGL
jgi:indole-3-glycerol phosphate synthase